jgi:transposase
MAQSPSDGHCAVLVGLCPGNDASAGNRKSGKTRKGSKWLKATEAAWAASHTKS